MRSVAQMVSFFESSSKAVEKPKKKVKSPPKLVVPTQIKQKIIMPKGGIPTYYAVPQRAKPKSPRYVRNVDVNKPPEKIDKDKIKNNMNNMKVLLEKRGVYKRPFRIEPPNYNNSNNLNVDQSQNQNQNNGQKPQFSQSKFLAAKSVFEKKNDEAINKAYVNKPMRKDIKKKAKTAFEE